jgi:hypothetical protein
MEQPKEAKHYVELRAKILKEIAAFDPFIPQNSLYEFMANHVVHENYYAWFSRYVQMACYALQVDLSLAGLGVRIVNEDDLVFVVNSSGTEVHFTGKVVGHQIVLAYNQVPKLQEGHNEAAENPRTDPS